MTLTRLRVGPWGPWGKQIEIPGLTSEEVLAAKTLVYKHNVSIGAHVGTHWGPTCGARLAAPHASSVFASEVKY